MINLMTITEFFSMWPTWLMIIGFILMVFIAVKDPFKLNDKFDGFGAAIVPFVIAAIMLLILILSF